jgi:hypothetical protein
MISAPSKRRYVYRLKLWKVYKYRRAQRRHGIRLDETSAEQDLSSPGAASTSSPENRSQSVSPCPVNGASVPGSNPIALEDCDKWRDDLSSHNLALENGALGFTSDVMANFTHHTVNGLLPSRKEAGDKMVYMVKTVRSKAERDQALLLLDQLRMAFLPRPCPLSERMVDELSNYLTRLDFRASHNWGQPPHPGVSLGTAQPKWDE